MSDHTKKFLTAVSLLKKNPPLVHNVTNLVTMETVANVLLALGASPIMAHAEEELDAILAMAQVLVLNIGTLDEAWLQSIEAAQCIALKRGLPIVFDPVGAGASRLRQEACQRILERGVTILRGNASEITAIANEQAAGRGVDSMQESSDVIDAATVLTWQNKCCVVVSGATDIVIDNNSQTFIKHGSRLMTHLTGMGCAVTAVIGAFAAVVKNDPALASRYAMLAMGLAAEKAEQIAAGPGSFYPALLDALYSLTTFDFNAIKIEFKTYDEKFKTVSGSGF